MVIHKKLDSLPPGADPPAIRGIVRHHDADTGVVRLQVDQRDTVLSFTLDERSPDQLYGEGTILPFTPSFTQAGLGFNEVSAVVHHHPHPALITTIGQVTFANRVRPGLPRTKQGKYIGPQGSTETSPSPPCARKSTSGSLRGQC